MLVALFLTAGTISAQDYTSILQTTILSSRSSDGMTAKDMEGLTIYSQTTNRRGNVEHIYANQMHNGIPIFNANVAATFRGETIIHMGDNLQRDIASRVRTNTAVLTPVQAATKAASLLGAGTANFSLLETKSSQEVLLNKGGVSLDEVPVKLVYQLTDDNEFRLAWDLDIHMLNKSHWYSVRIDAVNGELLSQNDWVSQCTQLNHQLNSISHATKKHTHKETSSFGFIESEANAALSGGQYNVFALPLESPIHGANTLITPFEDPDASPFGWHDTDGVAGADHTITRGNNVWAYEDTDGDNDTFGESPDGGQDLIFDFEYDFESDPSNMIDAVTTHLFYVNNIVHDVMYHYGFDEESGNYQEINYTGEGFGGDAVLAEAQDGSAFNNASFTSPADSRNGRMQMFLFTPPPPPNNTLTLTGGGVDGVYLGTPPVLFGVPIPPVGGTPLTANLVLAEDDAAGSDDIFDACDTLVNGAELNGNIAIVRRGTCDFSFKVVQAQNEGAIATIIVNTNGQTPPPVPGPGDFGDDVTIPLIVVTQADGEAFITALQNGESIMASIISPDPGVNRDSALDNGVVVHEYGHGISSRLAAGPQAAACVANEENMDEGWADFFALMFTMTAGDEAEDARGIVNYSIFEEIDEPGIRVRPYSTDRAINDLTYADTNDELNIIFPHGLGTVWASALWDMTWYLIDEYGFDADLYNGVAGNNIAIQLVVDGLRMQPCNTGFVQSRDAIISAIDINSMIPEEDKEEVKCGVFGMFAGRGLGINADQGNRFSRLDQLEDFEEATLVNGVCEGIPLPFLVPPEIGLPGGVPLLSTDEFETTSFSVYPNPSNGSINVNMETGLGQGHIDIIDLNGRVVFTQNSLLEGVININASELSNGVYLLQVSNDTVSETTKLVIK